MPDHDADARRALARLQRALEKSRRELGTLREAAGKADPSGVPTDEYESAKDAIEAIAQLISAEGARFQERILRGGGLDSSRLGRPGSS